MFGTPFLVPSLIKGEQCYPKQAAQTPAMLLDFLAAPVQERTTTCLQAAYVQVQDYDSQ